MRIRKFNESLHTLDYESVDFFDLVVERLKSHKGYAVFHIEKEDQYCQIFKFDSKEKFDREFSITKHPSYPGNMVYPNNVKEEFGLTDSCIIDGQEFTIDLNSLYLVIDGKLMR